MRFICVSIATIAVVFIAMMASLLAGCGGSSSTVSPRINLIVESSRDGVTWANVPVIYDHASVPAGWWQRVHADSGTTTRAQLDGNNIPDGGEVYIPNTPMQLRGPDWTWSFWITKDGIDHFVEVITNGN